jgi:hypothetical protein
MMMHLIRRCITAVVQTARVVYVLFSSSVQTAPNTSVPATNQTLSPSVRNTLAVPNRNSQTRFVHRLEQFKH